MNSILSIAALLCLTAEAHKVHTQQSYLKGLPEDMNQEDLVTSLGHQGADHDDDVLDSLEEQKEIK